MQNWKEPATSPIYLANGDAGLLAVSGFSLEDGSGHVFVHGRDVKVGPLPATWSALGYGEIVPIILQSGETIHTVLSPEDYSKHVAYLYRSNESIDATICLFDENSISWREMTEREYEQERRAWEADAKDVAQIKRAWREYRES